MNTAFSGNEEFTAFSTGFSAATQSGHLDRRSRQKERKASLVPTVSLLIFRSGEENEDPSLFAELLQGLFQRLIPVDEASFLRFTHLKVNSIE